MTAETEEVFGPEDSTNPGLQRIRAGHGVALVLENGEAVGVVAAVALALDDSRGGAYRVSMTTAEARALAAVLLSSAARADAEVRKTG